MQDVDGASLADGLPAVPAAAPATAIRARQKAGRAFFSGKVVSAVSFQRKRTAENYRRGYSLRSATLGSTAAALRAGK